jgi:hypothetical protein
MTQLAFEIAEMFREYSAAEYDEFAYQFALERTADIRTEQRRESAKLTRLRIVADPCRNEKRRTYIRNYMRTYDRQRRASDPAYLEAKRKATREAMRRQYARQREARAA